MIISTGKTARNIRRREILTRLLDLIESHSDKALVSEARMIILELVELTIEQPKRK